jgi:hypothetical protein
MKILIHISVNSFEPLSEFCDPLEHNALFKIYNKFKWFFFLKIPQEKHLLYISKFLPQFGAMFESNNYKVKRRPLSEIFHGNENYFSMFSTNVLNSLI